MTYILAIDQGTTSTRAILFDGDMQVAAVAQEEFPQHYPNAGWVEHDPEDLWSTTLSTCRKVLSNKGISASDIAGIGITNQRETTVVWDKSTGRAIHNAIFWQDRDFRYRGCNQQFADLAGVSAPEVGTPSPRYTITRSASVLPASAKLVAACSSMLPMSLAPPSSCEPKKASICLRVPSWILPSSGSQASQAESQASTATRSSPPRAATVVSTTPRAALQSSGAVPWLRSTTKT